ncbi:MAG: AraC family transcriptional regulator [Defluviitaleaceae bacterium]|nr:AraC family transcriptional regulator [Defluviitaleaceae bacterium]
MDILTGLNRAMDYIEANICNDVDIESAAETTPYSAYHLQKIFSYLTDISLAEYIRRRKMTLAALELQSSKVKVTDLALKYGYDSMDSFSRAFSRLHGVSPSMARNGGTALKVFPKLFFQISIKGGNSMEFQIKEMEAFRVVGLKRRFYHDEQKNKSSISGFWEELRQNGKLLEILKHCNDKFLASKSEEEAVGVCTNGDSDGLDYFIATSTDLEQAPDGLEIFTFPKNTYAVFHFTGELHKTMPNAEKMIFSEWMPSSGYDPVEGADLEVYSKLPHDSPDFEFWCYVPVKKSCLQT